MSQKVSHKQMEVISHLHVMEAHRWGTEVIEMWMKNQKVATVLDGLTAEEIVEAGIQWAKEINEKLGKQIY